MINPTSQTNLDEQIPILLLSGMGADHRVFGPQSKVFTGLTIPNWIEPEGRESIQQYAERFARQIDPGKPCIIGGASFGGVVAQEIGRHLDTKACFLIGSLKHPDEFRPILRFSKPFVGLIRWLPYSAGLVTARLISQSMGRLLSPFYRNILSQAYSSNSQFYRWAIPAFLQWQASDPPPDFPIYRIHGEKDSVIPIKYLDEPNYTVAGGGHVISIRHAQEVNGWMQSVIEEL